MYVRSGLLLSLLFLATPAWAVVPTCAVEKPTIDVHIIYEAPRLQKTVDRALFAQKPPEDIKHMPAAIEGVPERVIFQPMLGVSAPIAGFEGGCWKTTGSVQVYLGAKEVYVVMLEEVAEDVCVRDALWAHGVTHVAAHKKFLHSLDTAIKQALTERLSKPIPIRKTSQIDAQYELERTLSAAVKDVWESGNEANQEAQAALDVPDEARKLKSACSGAVGRAFLRP